MKRNDDFKKLVHDVRNFEFKNKIVILSAFATGAGVKFMFDGENFYLCSNKYPNRNLFFTNRT
jgi:hypothetical protein